MYFHLCVLYFLAIKTGRYTHEKRSQDIREIKSLERIEKTQHHIYDTFPTNNSIDEVKELVNTLIKAQKEMYGVNYDYWTNDEMINKLTQDCFVSCTVNYTPTHVGISFSVHLSVFYYNCLDFQWMN